MALDGVFFDARIPTWCEAEQQIVADFRGWNYHHKNKTGDIVTEIKFSFDTPGTMTIARTTVEPEPQVKGIAKKLVPKPISMAKTYDFKIIPDRSYAEAFFEAHKNIAP